VGVEKKRKIGQKRISIAKRPAEGDKKGSKGGHNDWKEISN